MFSRLWTASSKWYVLYDFVSLTSLTNVQLDALAVRTGIYACLFASRGHVYDTTQATWFGTDNIMDFWEDVLQMEADKITRKLEQWACMAGRSIFLLVFLGPYTDYYILGIDERETVQIMQRVCTRLLNSGLSMFPSISR
jgi:hypothetical protein